MEEEQAACPEPQPDSMMSDAFSKLWTDVMGILVSCWGKGRKGKGNKKMRDLNHCVLYPKQLFCCAVYFFLSVLQN